MLQVRPDVEGQEALGGSGRDYLKAIYELQASTGRATTSAVAEQLGVRDPSATRMIKKLAGLHLVEHTPYHGAKLTPVGEVLTRRVLHRRELIARYLIACLGYPEGEAGAEADRLERAVSEKFEARIAVLLGNARPEVIVTRHSGAAQRRERS